MLTVFQVVKVLYSVKHERREVTSVLLQADVGRSKVKMNPDFNNLL
jgi:hypothetical protein